MEWEGREGKEKEGKEKEGKGWGTGLVLFQPLFPLFLLARTSPFPLQKQGRGSAEFALLPPFILIPADHFWGQLAALPPRPLCPFKAPAPLIDVSGPV